MVYNMFSAHTSFQAPLHKFPTQAQQRSAGLSSMWKYNVHIVYLHCASAFTLEISVLKFFLRKILPFAYTDPNRLCYNYNKFIHTSYMTQLILNEVPLFVTNCYTSTLSHIDNHNIVCAVENIQHTCPSNQFSNSGGYQSPSMYSSAWDNPETAKLFENHIMPGCKHIMQVIHGLATGQPAHLNYWYNVNPKYAYNREHTHPEAYISGVYYVQVPKNSGRIHFLRSQSEIDKMQFMRDFICQTDHPGLNSEHCFEPHSGMLILFPGHVSHYVTQNLTTDSDDRRISLSFNFHGISRPRSVHA